jgi:hypothetical protein
VSGASLRIVGVLFCIIYCLLTEPIANTMLADIQYYIL